MRRLAADARSITPWKNGGGTTTEIARWPPESTLDSFAWRVSLATVAAAGPFSRFPGVDRTIAVVEGEGMLLAVEGRGAIELRAGGAPLAFPGDVDVDARLLAGPTVDFNAMSRRGAWRHWVTRRALTCAARVEPLGDLGLVYVARGATAALARGDALWLDRGESVDLAPVSSPAGASPELLFVDLWRA